MFVADLHEAPEPYVDRIAINLKIEVHRAPGLRAHAIHCDVISQLVELQRRAVPREIKRARTGHTLKRAESAGSEPRRRQRSAQDAAVDRFANQDDLSVTGAEREQDVAIARVRVGERL